MTLVIVESPTKAKTLAGILGPKYKVIASYGHVRDLPTKELGVDLAKDFNPTYITPTKALKQVALLKEEVKKAEEVVLATDPDREGEAIAWHVAVVTGLTDKKASRGGSYHRLVFHEITPEAIREAFKHPRDLDYPLVDSQQARRILDRLVGYLLSPLLWRKVRYGLSAGRVQSVAVRLIVDREREREAFKPEESWTIEALLVKGVQTFKASLWEFTGKKISLKTEKAAKKIVEQLSTVPYVVSNLDVSSRLRSPYAPFTTASLQQTASNQLGYSAKRTMMLAQRLFEAGLITYHRTDSTYLADSALKNIRQYIESQYGATFLPEKSQMYKTKAKLAQEAHEAIRPTKFEASPKLAGEAQELYELIWRRTVACQMNPARFEQTTVDIRAGEDGLFRAVGSALKFEGFLKVYGLPEDNSEPEVVLPKLKVGDKLTLQELTPFQHFTQPPARYTEATLIKALEQFGIGRPSTYAPIISTILDRGYVVKDGRSIVPQDVARVVTDLLVENFREIVDVDFTARMEDELDDIARGEKDRVDIIRKFYTPFFQDIKKADKTLSKRDVTTLEKTKEICPECGNNLVIKLGKYGRFLSCSAFPKCKYAHPLESQINGGSQVKVDAEQLNAVCEKCKGKLVLKEGRFGRFLACENYPKCKFTKNYLEKIDQKCSKCQEGDVVVKRTRRGKVFYGCSRYPQCDFASWKRPGGSDPSS
ncbi:MAG: type I DNA topoisomerase [bacterium]|nr:type I DNA topoisomerase [bacterium]